MPGVAEQVRELISSNIASLIEAAANPEKMLRLLRSEIQESIISLQSGMTRSNRQHGRLEGEIGRLDDVVADWSGKARLAMDKGREDLARGALQAREEARTELEAAKQQLATLAAEIEQSGQAIDQLETKLGEIRRQIATLPASGEDNRSRTGGGARNAIDERLDHIAALEHRIRFAGDNRPAPTQAEIEQELRLIDQDSKIEAELAAMRAAASRKE